MTPGRATRAGGLSLAVVVGLTAAAFAALVSTAASHDGTAALFTPYVGRVVRFTLVQAAASTVLSVIPALIVARALARRRAFPGRRLALRLFALPLALPQIVAVLGVVEIWGRQGLVNRAGDFLGLGPVIDIYGLTGILIAHVFFNLPLASRLFVSALERVPGESWRLAAQLGFDGRAVWRLIEWPVLRTQLAAVAGLVFMLCVASFTVVLTLGGGPRATTIEVAIYQALRFDFDPGLAVRLALMQLVLTGTLVLAGVRITQTPETGSGLDRRILRPDGATPGARLIDALAITVALVITVPVFAAILAGGLAAPLVRLALEPSVWQASATSLAIASAAAVLAIALAWPLGELAASGGQPSVGRSLRLLGGASQLASSLVLVMPPVVLGAGWFVLLLWVPGGIDFGFGVVIVINALMAIPFVTRVLGPAIGESRARHDRLCASLGIAGLARLRLIDWPVLRRPLSVALAFALALSLGDLGAIALFGSEHLVTLPLLLYQRLGSYRVNDAAGLALFLGALCLAIMTLAERAARRDSGL